MIYDEGLLASYDFNNWSLASAYPLQIKEIKSNQRNTLLCFQRADTFQYLRLVLN